MNTDEIALLRRFFVDRERAKDINRSTGNDPNIWHLVHRYRNLPREEFEKAKEQIYV